jgi:hypothetical protein
MIPARFAIAAPPLLLASVAAVQMTLALTAQLSPWKGGGFGMFASNDGLPFRALRVFVSAPMRSEEVQLPPSLLDAAARAATFPRTGTLEAFARSVAARERRHGREVATVRVEVWRASFSPTLEATRHLLRALTVDVGADPLPSSRR